jgi:hypothetical protein
VVRGQKRLGFEINRTTTPTITRSIHTAVNDLGLDRLDVIHAGEYTFPMKEKVRAVAFDRLSEDLDPF